MSTLLEELEQAAGDLDHLSRIACVPGICDRAKSKAARLRARIEHVRKFMAVAALLSPDGKDFADKLVGPIPEQEPGNE